MFRFHNQRLSVLLFLMCGGYSILYLFMPLYQQVNYVYDSLAVSSMFMNSCFIIDSMSISFSVVVFYISSCVFFFSRYYMGSDPFFYRFMWLLLTFVASMNILILSGSLFIMLLGWDGLGVSSFALIMYYQSRESLVASFLTLLINRLGDVVIMSSMSMFVLFGSTLLTNYFDIAVDVLMFLFLFAALTKSAQYPFCAWLPAAMAAPTPVSALVHSSTLVTAGIYILIRACSSNYMPADVCNLLLFFGAVTSFIGGFCAIYENDLKKLIALSTLSQLGVMMFSLGLGLYNLSLLHLFTHAMFKALLFLAAGCVLMLSFGVQDLRLLGGVTKSNSILLIFFNISAFCLMGLPFLSAFYSKHVILAAMWCQSLNMFSVMLMLLSTFFSSVYMLRLLKALNWGPTHSPLVVVTIYWEYYLPMGFLFLGSCLSGWFFTSNESMNTYTVFSSGVFDIFLYVIGVLGILAGLFYTNKRGMELASSMFFMVPTWYNVNFLSYKFVSTLKWLDSGWLEPFTYGVTLQTLSTFIYMKSNLWAMRSFHFAPYIISSFLIMVFVLCLF